MANEPSSPMCLMPQSGITPEQLSLISRFAVASIGSQGTVGGLLVGGLVSCFIFNNLNSLWTLLYIGQNLSLTPMPHSTFFSPDSDDLNKECQNNY